MGMSASQARFLTLTARKTNTEYEGQQINQQRTALSNESSNYYSQLTSMTVPTPPSSSDYTKITYTFVNGTELNTITSLIATDQTAAKGVYKLNYTQAIPGDSMVVSGTSQVTRVPANGGDNVQYFIGNDELDYTADTAVVKAAKEALKDAQDALSENTDAGQTATLTAAVTAAKTSLENAQKQDPTSEDIGKFRDHLKKSIPEHIVNSMTDDEVTAKISVEQQYDAMMKEKYGDGDYRVMYRQAADNQSYEPVFFSEAELERFDYNQKTGLSLGGLKTYVFGQETEVREIKNKEAKVEQDSTGRYMSIFIYDKSADDGAGTKYDLTTTTVADEAGYNDAMNQYFYDKAVYDQKVQEINAKIEVIQVQDKNLELKLKQLDTEQNAIQTEMDAVKKVISKNVESSFKTFNA